MGQYQGAAAAMTFSTSKTTLPGVVLIEPKWFPDQRGFFMESWNQRDFADAGLPSMFVQDSHSRSHLGVLRGLHCQDMSAPMGKLVRCTVGSIFDVAVDLRVGSPTFGHWLGVDLTAENKRQIYVPPGFAHGLQATSDVVEVQYKQTAFYAPAAEKILAWDDPDVAVVWPLPNPSLSARDQKGRRLKDYLQDPIFQYGDPRL
jgi:dTDP-4-dehydrorhamnose 3,5-epimerase